MGITSQGIFPRWMIRDGRGPALIVGIIAFGAFSDHLWDGMRSRLCKQGNIDQMEAWKTAEVERVKAEEG